MGIPKIFYISEENWDLLKKEENKSKLVNKLLDEYFERTAIERMSEEQLLIEKAKRKLAKEYEEKLKLIDISRIAGVSNGNNNKE